MPGTHHHRRHRDLPIVPRFRHRSIGLDRVRPVPGLIICQDIASVDDDKTKTTTIRHGVDCSDSDYYYYTKMTYS